MTLQTIADALGVSRTTVSNAYNRPDQLAPELRERILGTARKLGYSGPDPAARRLRSGRREAVGLLFGEELSYAFTDPAAVLLLQGIARATEPAGLSLLIVPARGSAEAGSAVHDAVVSAFGVYCMPEEDPSLLAALDRGVPMVVIDEPRLPGHAYVGIEDRRGARLAAQHLLDLGHRRIAVVSERLPIGADGAPVAVHTTDQRLAGYREALEGAGLDWSAVPRVDAGANRLERGLEAGREVLALDPRPTALLVITDQIALGVVEAARELGLAVPDDVSVVGFDDVPGAAWSQPALTTVRQPLLEKGELTGRLLIADAPDREVILPVELVVRGSTAHPPAD